MGIVTRMNPLGGGARVVTLTVSTNPASATCTLTYNGNSYTTKTVEVPAGTKVSYSISKSGYVTQTGTWTITEDTTKSITLATVQYTLTVNVKNSGGSALTANITLNGTTYSSVSSKSISVSAGSTVTYSIAKSGYTTQSGSWTINSDTTKNITLTLSTCTLTVTTSPSNATCVLTYNGTNYTQKSLTVNAGSTVSYSVSASGYFTKTGSWTISSDTTKTVSLTASYTLTVNPSPSSGTTVTLTASGYTQSGNSITVAGGTTVTYSVYNSTYGTTTGSETLTTNRTLTCTGSTAYNDVSYSVDKFAKGTSDPGTLGSSTIAFWKPTSQNYTPGGSDSSQYCLAHIYTNDLNSSSQHTEVGTIDGNTSNSNTVADSILVIYFNTAVKVSSFIYTIYSTGSGSYNGQQPKGCTIYGSNNNSSYTQITTATNSVYSNHSTWSVTVNSSTYYNYYKLVFNRTKVSSGGKLYCRDLSFTLYKGDPYKYWSKSWS